ncbi:beta-eliminating lyase-related protein, partial [bacterium]|nr:beta-eliminating lyase-related protein [bacterium]
LYTKEELTDISAVCYDCGLYLFVDGARMAYGLTSPANDLSLEDYANLCDAFYLGGTKCGALFGEALVILNGELDRDFRYAIKQHGGMLAKGRLLGLQFLALLEGEDGTGCSPYYRMAARADALALRIRAAFEAKGCPMLFDSPTNQQFPILPDAWLAKLGEKYATSWIAKPDESHTAVRFCTSWATREEDVDALLADIAAL